MRDTALAESAVTCWVLTGIAIGFLGLFLALPLLAVFSEALRRGVDAYLAAFDDPDTQSAIGLTLLIAAIAAVAVVTTQ